MENYTLIDSIGTQHTFHKVPQRIISLVPSQTELLVDLGLESKIVGITKFCIHPKDLRSKKAIVGGTKKVDCDKIKALVPDVIICNKEENTLEMVETLRTICPVWVTDIVTVEDNFKMISDFGNLFDCVAEAENWNRKLTLALSDFKSFIQTKPVKKVAYFIWKKPYMVSGSANFINELLELNHFENVFANQQRYPEVEPEKINANGDLDFIFLSSEPYPFKEKDVLEMHIFTQPAKIVLVDGEMFSWYGSRLLKAFDYFKELHQKL
ncbi:ABC-type Fe3+-hydroxamate transport system, substrate-binding protein [Flavobacterium glycines]|uniref:ABC-type Fe3+-hydroxamate transport system, substrate-binding protein n=1 Tax=Flavobacterium glycines TaxID=551990 RepID=A0A1G8YBJ8_9FLAO|nr:helical backbone metal receptor [Flavobacterium glycines]SDK00043.1 ABC-type Fe3+-hydroxamate transport system, substrate-binding protein [Flavobacterium glycines]